VGCREWHVSILINSRSVKSIPAERGIVPLGLLKVLCFSDVPQIYLISFDKTAQTPTITSLDEGKKEMVIIDKAEVEATAEIHPGKEICQITEIVPGESFGYVFLRQNRDNSSTLSFWECRMEKPQSTSRT
jgi:hypothetical protein